MHSCKIIHRDLKPDNILIMKMCDLSVCITDLGLACRITDEDELWTKCGTPGYVDPEILNNKWTSLKADIFS